MRSLKSTSKCFSFLIWEHSLKRLNAKCSTLSPLTNLSQTYPENSVLLRRIFKLYHGVFLQFNMGVAGGESKI